MLCFLGCKGTLLILDIDFMTPQKVMGKGLLPHGGCAWEMTAQEYTLGDRHKNRQ